MTSETGILKIGQLVAVLAIFGIGFIGTASALDLGDPDISAAIPAQSCIPHSQSYLPNF